MDRADRAPTNQAPPLVGHDVVASDVALVDALRMLAADADAVLASLRPLGALAGTAEAREHAMAANRNPPELMAFDRYGARVDEVRFHPSWHWLMGEAVGFGLAGTPWLDDDADAHLRRAAGFYTWSQVESGHGCPVSMTYAAVPALRVSEPLASDWVPRLAARAYDPGLEPPTTKAGCLAGMGMTEKQGGSDVRSNVTTAAPLGPDDGDGYRLDGHKWFTSAPMNDLFLVLAQAPGGLTCFAVPRVRDDGTHNPFRIQRLKDKLGNRSNASAEIELDETWGRRLGDEGRGVATIIEMVAATRLDCVLGIGGADAQGRRRGVLARRPPASIRHRAGRPAADAECRRRPRHRGGGRPRDRAAPGTRSRPRRRPARGRTTPDRATARQVLGLQADAVGRRRGAGVPGRQRLRRGLRACRCCSASRR